MLKAMKQKDKVDYVIKKGDNVGFVLFKSPAIQRQISPKAG